ncbi:hypothetical protein BGZ80_009748 [Entomortierella chlamydospora]|uniref:Uncharacterized protein n=1 Tax=Entomortierella chlamydospora TaxID=101097 RepID=A0A9P6T0I9_9FUNG|nr:hypothetical protein BGZ79_009522 [Entomortierella chlamydospora]KAG0015619.1 hypothetical protein BGZ80_009748 [Entomortierella chlamydospora]
MTDDIEEHNDQLRFNTASDNQSSRDRLTNTAILVKKKLYKLLKSPYQAQSRTSPSKEDEDEEVKLNDPSRSVSSVYSVTSSLRAKMPLTPKTKTVLRQVKRRINTAARTVMSEASKAANDVTPILRSNTRKKSSTTYPRRFWPCTPQYEHGYDSENYYDPESIEDPGMDYQEQYHRYHSGYNNEGITGHPQNAR